MQSKIDMLIISDRLCLSAITFCTVSAIGISVQSHIGTSLVKTLTPAQSIVSHEAPLM